MKRILIDLVRFYQRRLSGLKKPCCRFYPSCSEYAIMAIQKHGALRGSIKALWRILRCNPFCKGGIDFP